MDHVLAVDLGCTKYIVAVADAAGNELAREGGPTLGDEGPAAGVERLADALARACARAGVEPGGASALGIGAPGPLDRAAGMILSPPQLPWGDFELARALGDRVGVEQVVIDNDCKAGGIGEHRSGAGRGASSMVYFGVGTGIGGCIVLDGRVHYGASDNAAEIGHLCVWMGGPPCGCGSEGCLEGIASGSGIERRARTLAAAGRDEAATLLQLAEGDPAAITGATVVAAANTGDPAAIRIWEDAQRALGAACASMMNALSPEVIVLGGGIVAKSGQGYIDRIELEARRRALGPNEHATRIVAAELGADSVLRGAIHMALDAAAITPAV
jgi:glucokinase